MQGWTPDLKYVVQLVGGRIVYMYKTVYVHIRRVTDRYTFHRDFAGAQQPAFSSDRGTIE